MFGTGRILGLAVALACGAATSQAPEFAQQYRQRLNGALHELRLVVSAFDADATRNNLTRERAIVVYEEAGSDFLRDRATSVRVAIGRLGDLERQSAAFDEASPVLRPLIVARSPDGPLLQGALDDYEPAVPLTLHGFIWTGVGVLFGFSVVWLLGLLFRRKKHYPAHNLRV
ncbi:DUF2937 family protein [Nitratireductor aquimarinus]|uniref:DUF2937 family protein n=1 Tax=Alphaproteobacteria TaxID=28211 RepID=UPI0019D339FE|nr:MULTISPECIES: DUF2937 family protein [Alphaproteobacteria]MBN7757516.1 DUF2937 family protein [Nitratireductor aquimarinus]MBY6000276.1 DUF2937 family protein [Tritonibacter mobilis]MBY6022306.1 DUF2937 family protein [Nitratireductor sp. DP7N14-4]MCV0380158.1 DUF2937 family protein [Nitratireductor sp.]